MGHNKLIDELKLLSEKGIFSKDKIEWWLLKYEKEYNHLFKILEADKVNYTYPRNLSKYKEEAQFLDTYEVLINVSNCFRDEVYYREQIELYDCIKSDVAELSSWLKTHKLDEGKKQSKFKELFQNTTKLSDYEFVIRYPFSLPVSIKLDEADFKETLHFLEILERSEKVQAIGTITMINDLEVFEKKITKTDEGESYRRAFTRRNIIVSTDDVYGSELLIKFMDEKTHLLKNLELGQSVKVYADLLGGKNVSDKLGYSLSLLGWDIEILK